MNILDEIVEVKKEEVKKLHSEYSYSSFAESEEFNNKSLSLVEKIRSDKNISIIAEIKKSSPSKGILRKDFNHVEIADIYFNNGASAISVLTDKSFFMGDIKYLRDISHKKTKPLLRKDFIIDPFQVFEARSFGADAVLLISEILSAEQIKELTQAAKETGLDVLLELHNIDQLDKIDFSINELIGVNNRDLKDFSVDLNRTVEVSKLLPMEVTLVSESGISGKNDIDKLKHTKASAVLAGEVFMKSPDIKKSIQEFTGWCRNES